MGIFASSLGMAVAFRPQVGLPYPVWTNDKDLKLRYGATVVSLIPIQGLLSIAERHLIEKYGYIQVMIGVRIYFASPEDWVPENSNVVREKVSGTLLGIPKVPDGFNIW